MLFDVYYVEDWVAHRRLIWRVLKSNCSRGPRSLLSMVVPIELGTRVEPEVLVAASNSAAPSTPIGIGTKSRDRLAAEPVP